MTVQEYMTALSNAPGSTGEYMGRDMVLGLQTADTQTDPKSYTYVGYHIESYGAALSSSTEDKSYVYEGDSTLKKSTQRTFAITGQALIGDDFHDYIRSFECKFGTGSTTQKKYCYFHAGTKKGEQGTMNVIVNNDGNGDASSHADIDVELKSCGPVSEYTYTTTG